MAEEKKETQQQVTEAAPKRSKKGLLLGGGVLGLVAAGWALSLVAMPAKREKRLFQGPYVVALSQEDVQVNLAGEGGKRFLVMTLQAEFDAYDQAYASGRVADGLYQARLKDAVIRVARQKTKADLDDSVGEELFKEDVLEAVDPILFPIHVGNPLSATEPDEKSGLRQGRSIERSTLRSGFYAHELRLDVDAGTIRLDEGPETRFQGTENDLLLTNEHGDTLFVDVTELVPGFSGVLNAGTMGRLRNVYFGKLLVQ